MHELNTNALFDVYAVTITILSGKGQTYRSQSWQRGNNLICVGPRDKQGVQLMPMGVGYSNSMQMVTQIGCWDVNKGQQVYDREKTFSQDMANPFLRRIK